MKAIVFGATGMVGQAVLAQCLRSDELAKGMIEIARQRPEKRVLESADGSL